MSDQVLTPEEVDTLLDDSEVTADGNLVPAEAVNFDFEEQYDLLLARMPKLKKVTELIEKNLGESFSSLFGREIEVTIPYMQTQRFADFMQRVQDQNNFSVIEIQPQKTKGLIHIDPQLLYVLVDQYFGGSGRMTGLDFEKALSATEQRLSVQIVEAVLRELDVAWKQVSAFSFKYVKTEDANGAGQVMSFTDIAVLLAIQVTMGESTGEFQLVLPYSWLETIRPLLTSQNKVEEVQDQKWKAAFARELGVVEVQVSCSINGPSMTLSEILKLKAGDVVPILRPSLVILNVEELPVFEGTLGTSQGKNAVKITQLLDVTEAS